MTTTMTDSCKDKSAPGDKPVQILGIGKAAPAVSALRERLLLSPDDPLSSLFGMQVADYRGGAFSRMKFPGKMYLSFRSCPDRDIYGWMGRWCVETIRSKGGTRLLVFAAILDEELGAGLLPSLAAISRSLSIPALALAILPEEAGTRCREALGRLEGTGCPFITIDRAMLGRQYGELTGRSEDELCREYLLDALLTTGRMILEARRDEECREDVRRVLGGGGRIHMGRGLSEQSEGVRLSLARACEVPSSVTGEILRGCGLMILGVDIATPYADLGDEAVRRLREDADALSREYPYLDGTRPSPRMLLGDVPPGREEGKGADMPLPLNKTVALFARPGGWSPPGNLMLLLDDLLGNAYATTPLSGTPRERLRQILGRRDERRSAYLDYLYRRYGLWVEQIGTPPRVGYEGTGEYARLLRRDAECEGQVPVPVRREDLLLGLGIYGFVAADRCTEETDDKGYTAVEFLFDGMLCVLSYIPEEWSILMDVPSAMVYGKEDEEYADWICGKMFEQEADACCEIDYKGNVTLSYHGHINLVSGIAPFVRKAVDRIAEIKKSFIRSYQDNYDSLEWRIHRRNMR